MNMNDERYIYYRDVLDYIKIILGKTKLTKERKQLIETKYKELIQFYNEDIKRIEGNEIDELKAIYKAMIFEYDSGKIDALYECNKEHNEECSKESCTRYDYCKHTLNKKYAKNFINKGQT